jgi:hypothetical protein
MDYNTARKKLALPEYGRHIQKMVDFAITVEDREERNRVAKAIISIMGNLNPGLRDQGDTRHKLWDHLFIMSDFKLDIDSPYPIPEKEKFTQKPEPVEYNSNTIKYMHYGRTIEQLIEAAINYEDETKRGDLIMLIANHMKKSYLTWNRSLISDETIINDLEELSGGKIKLDKDTKLADSRDFQSKGRKKRSQRSN